MASQPDDSNPAMAAHAQHEPSNARVAGNLFKSKINPGVVLNRYGIALRGSDVCDDHVRCDVIREAISAGARRVYCNEDDVGMIYKFL